MQERNFVSNINSLDTFHCMAFRLTNNHDSLFNHDFPSIPSTLSDHLRTLIDYRNLVIKIQIEIITIVCLAIGRLVGWWSSNKRKKMQWKQNYDCTWDIVSEVKKSDFQFEFSLQDYGNQLGFSDDLWEPWYRWTIMIK